MEQKINNTNEKLKSQDKPGFHRAKGKQHGLSPTEKESSEKPVKKTNKPVAPRSK